MAYEHDYAPFRIEVDISGPTEEGWQSVHITRSYKGDADDTAFNKAVRGIAEGMGFNSPEIEELTRPAIEGKKKR